MQKDNSEFFRTALIEYVKRHDECGGKIMVFINHIDKAAKVAQSLPLNVQQELKLMIFSGLIANVISSLFFK